MPAVASSTLVAFAATTEVHASVRATARVMDVDVVQVDVDDRDRMTAGALLPVQAVPNALRRPMRLKLLEGVSGARRVGPRVVARLQQAKTARRDGATWLRVTYRVAGAPEAGLDKLAPAVDQVIGEQVRRLKAFIETGKPD